MNLSVLKRKPLYLVLTGPTAVGKTALSLQLAHELNAEIVSLDSRQVYREMSIGTAKPSEEELKQVRHHFIHERSLRSPYSAGSFAQDVWRRTEAIALTGKIPLMTGGCMLYIEAVTQGLAPIPEVSEEVRFQVSQMVKDKGSHFVIDKASNIDPEYVRMVGDFNVRRAARVLEVYLMHRRPISYYFKRRIVPHFRSQIVVLYRERQELYARINQRVEQMLDRGLVEEVEEILAQGFQPSITPLQTIGYREVIAYLQGHISYDEMVRLLKRNTRRYAKRQLTWFRNRMPDALWLSLSDYSEVEIIEHILARYAQSA